MIKFDIVILSLFWWSGFGGLVVSVLASWYPRSRVQTRPKPADFSSEKNP